MLEMRRLRLILGYNGCLGMRLLWVSIPFRSDPTLHPRIQN